MQPSSKPNTIHRLVPFLILAALVCIFLSPVLFAGRVLLPAEMTGKMSPWNASAPKASDVYWNVLAWDSNAEYYPSRVLLGRAIRSGEIPLWNPYQFSGYPFVGDMLSAALYPPNWLFAVLPASLALGLLAALHLFLAGAFTYIFLRGLKLSPAASTFGGIAFMLSGFSIAWLELPVFLSVGAWLPLVLHLSRLALERKSAYYAAGAGLALAMLLLGGHPQIAFYCVLAIASYWAYLGIASRKQTPIGMSVLLGVITFAVGLSLAAPQLLPLMELASASHRGVQGPTSAGYAGYSSLAMPVGHLITLLIPDFFGTPAKGTYWGSNEYAEFCAYIGILTLLFIPLAFGGKARSRGQVWFFAGLGVLALSMALGTGINRLFYYCIPGFTKAGSPARVLYLFVFSGVILGSVGFDRLLDSIEEKRQRIMSPIVASALGMLVFGLVLFVVNLNRLNGDVAWTDLLGQVSMEIRIFVACLFAAVAVIFLASTGKVSRQVGIALVVCILSADLVSFGFFYNQTSGRGEVYPSTKLTDFLRRNSGLARIMPLNDKWSLRKIPNAVLPPNSASVYGLFDVSGYDSLYPRRYKELLDAAANGESCPPENGNMVFARNPESPVYDLLGVKWIISNSPVAGKDLMLDGCSVHRNPNAFPRVFVVHAEELATDAEMLERITGNKTNLRDAVLVDPKDAFGLGSGTADGKAGSDRAEITRYTFNTVRVRVNSSTPGILVLTDEYFPGWQAYVDGKRAHVTRVDYDFRGVPVPAGEHTVLFSYEPKPFRTGLRFAGAGFVFLCILGVAGLFSKRRGGKMAKR